MALERADVAPIATVGGLEPLFVFSAINFFHEKSDQPVRSSRRGLLHVHPVIVGIRRRRGVLALLVQHSVTHATEPGVCNQGCTGQITISPFPFASIALSQITFLQEAPGRHGESPELT